MAVIIVKVTFNRDSVERLAPDTHFNTILKKALQLVIDQLILLACPPGHLPNTLQQLEVIQMHVKSF